MKKATQTYYEYQNDLWLFNENCGFLPTAKALAFL